MLAERARAASESFRRQGAEWDEMGALGLPVGEVEAALQALLPAGNELRLLDIGTGTGRVLELLAPQISGGIGIDASRAMLALARDRLAQARLSHCVVRQGDMYRLPFADGSFDCAVLQMVLHYAEDPQSVLAEAARILRPGGCLLLVELFAHERADLLSRQAHRWPGFSPGSLGARLRDCGLDPGPAQQVGGELPVIIFAATKRPGALPLDPARDSVPGPPILKIDVQTSGLAGVEGAEPLAFLTQ